MLAKVKHDYGDDVPVVVVVAVAIAGGAADAVFAAQNCFHYAISSFRARASRELYSVRNFISIGKLISGLPQQVPS